MSDNENEQKSAEGIHHASHKPASAGKIKAIELKHGKFYNCTMDGDLGPEDCCFVQLAVDAASNRRFMLLGARHLFAKNLSLVHKLIKMSFNDLDTEDFDGSSDLQLWEFLLDDNGLLKAKSYDCYLAGFTETDIIKPDPTC